MQIKSYDFSIEGKLEVLNEAKGRDWPVVYLINNERKLYIGETSNLFVRFGQHLESKRKNHLTKIHVIFDDEFNKSAVLDIEQSLIRMCGADQKFNLLNGNAGQSAKHNYYQREKYLNKIEGSDEEQGIWSALQDLGLANGDYNSIVNSDLFTYSPYTSLTVEQEEVCYNVLNDVICGLLKNKGNGTTCVIKGSAGTGKTILAIYLISLITNANERSIDVYKDEDSYEYASFKNKILHKIKKYVEEFGQLRIGYVLPMTSIRRTLKAVFAKTKKGLKSNMVIGPTEIADGEYDILLVDETHRMPKRKNLGWMGDYDKTCRKLGLSPEATNTLDWVMKCSKSRILFYDPNQSIKGSDISQAEFEATISSSDKIIRYELTTQMRCEGGTAYIDYLNEIFNCVNPEVKTIKNYDVKVFENPNSMIEAIKKLNDQYGLCRNVAGYSWEWKTKKVDLDKKENSGLYDIKFGDKTYCWNMTNKEWILRKESINEIGCIHTVQGYDLNYVGVILGKEIDYDKELNQITISPDNFYDTNVKKEASPQELKTYIINAYKVMMERGIKGCYIYACNKSLREYLKKYL